jgi:hypothetical protein
MDSARLGVDKDTGLFMATLVSRGQQQSYPVRVVSDDAIVALGSGKDERLRFFGIELRRRYTEDSMLPA